MFCPEFDDHLLGLLDVPEEIVCTAQVHQLLDIVSKGQVAVVPNETHHCCVVCILDDVIRSRCSAGVMSQREQQWAQDTDLSGADGEGDGDAVSHSLTEVCW